MTLFSLIFFSKSRFIVAFFLCGSVLLVYPQHDFKGKVIDSKTKEPIPYVNIGIVEAGVGTVSDEEGLFHLPIQIEDYGAEAQIQFSSLGYRTMHIAVQNIPMVYNEYPVLPMVPEAFELNEVVVSDKNKNWMITEKVGYRNEGEEVYGYWKDNVSLGGELATKIVVKKGVRKLEQCEFDVWYNPSDSLLLRVNFYKNDGPFGKPGTNLNTSGENILCVVHSNDKIVEIDLRPYDIYVAEDFTMSLELLKVYGDTELGLVIAAASYQQYGSYRRYASQDLWEEIDNRNMAYRLRTLLMVSQKEAERHERRYAKRKSKQKVVSGFVILDGRMLSNVEVFNNRSKEKAYTDDNGRYNIPYENNDVLSFSKRGLKDKHLKILDRPTLNVQMERL